MQADGERPEPAADDLMERIATLDLSAAERKLVEYLLSIPEYEFATATSAQIAERTMTSRSTLDRLSRKLGVAGHKQLRRALLSQSRSMKAQVGAIPALEPTIAEGNSASDIAFKVFNNAAVRALKFSELLAQGPALEHLIEALMAARAIQIFGAGASAIVGLDLHQRLLRLGLNIGFAEDAHTQIALAALMRPDDLAIAISYSGRTGSTVRAAEIARNRKARVAVILGAPDSPLGTGADIRILTPPGVGLFGTDAMMTRILQMMLNEVLFHCLSMRNRDLLENARSIDAVLEAEKIR